MRICFCLAKLSFSGAENVARYLMEKFINDGHEVGVLLLASMPRPDELIPGLTVLDGIVSETGPAAILKRIRKERKALKEYAPDAFVIFNCEMAFSGIPASFGLKKMKTIVCERNDPTMVPPSSKRRSIRNFLYRFADAGVYQTEVIASYFKRTTPKNYVIQNPIREPGVKCLPCVQRKKIFATVARLDDKQKNQSMMIRGFVKAAKVHPEFELHMLGEGPDREKYENLIRSLHAESFVKLLGNKERPTDYIREYRAFLLTSEFEGMPNALMEAMSIGLPCISTDCKGGGAAALIQNGWNGILIERNDEEALVKSILELMESEKKCDEYGNRAYEINDRLNGSAICEQWLSILGCV